MNVAEHFDITENGAIRAGSSSWTALPRDAYGSPFSVPVPDPGFASLEWDTYPASGVGLADNMQPVREQSCPGGAGAEPTHERAVSASGISSLDLITNNRHNGYETRDNPKVPEYYRRPIGRGKFCGRLSIAGDHATENRKLYRRVNCGSWSCSYCGPRKARTARCAIRTVAEKLDLRYFLTLTLDPRHLCESMGMNHLALTHQDMEKIRKFAVPHLRLCFNKFREYLRRRYGVPPKYICVLEFTQKGFPHLHILFDRYIEQEWISDVWDSLGGGRIVFIKRVKIEKVARYLSKYLTKELLLSAPKGTRRITTARAIKLFPKFQSGIAWELLRESIWNALSRVRMHGITSGVQPDLFCFVSLEVDEENYLKAFTVHNPT